MLPYLPNSYMGMIPKKVLYKLFFKITFFCCRAKKDASTTPAPTLVRSSSEEVHVARDKSRDNATYREIILENKVRLKCSILDPDPFHSAQIKKFHIKINQNFKKIIYEKKDNCYCTRIIRS